MMLSRRRRREPVEVAAGWPRCRLCGKRLNPDRPLVEEVDAWTRETSRACLDCYSKSGTIVMFHDSNSVPFESRRVAGGTGAAPAG